MSDVFSASHPHDQRSAATNSILPNSIINVLTIRYPLESLFGVKLEGCILFEWKIVFICSFFYCYYFLFVVSYKL